MARKLGILFVLAALMTGTAAAQDARSILQAAANAMGVSNLKTVRYSGTGYIAIVGQNYNPESDWPRFELTSYTRTMDYGAGASREEYTRKQGNYPPRGGGFQPIQGEPRTISLLSERYAWDLDGQNPVPQPGRYNEGISITELRQLEIILSPHGLLKAAMAANDVAAMTQAYWAPAEGGLTGEGRKATIVSFTALGKYRVNATINDQNLVELVTTWIPNPVYGDMIYEWRYTEYKDFGGIKFPTIIHVHQGDLLLSPAQNYLDLRVNNVQPNVDFPAMPVPAAVRQAVAPPVRVESQKLAEGVWLVGGGSHNSIAVEYRDFVAVVEAPLSEARSLAVIAEVAKLIPNKPIRYLVNTHHHFDHSGGLRTYLAQGATIVTHQGNVDFYRKVMFVPGGWTLQPDKLARFYPMFTLARNLPLEPVHQKYTISDGVKVMEIYPMQGTIHNQYMLMVYLPKEKILINADHYSPDRPPQQNPNMPTLFQNMQRLKLDVVQHVPIHGRPGNNDEFLKLVSKN